MSEQAPKVRIDEPAQVRASHYRPSLPDWGVYLRPPEGGEEWIHPEDRELAKAMIPSRRVFKRVRWDGEYYHLLYGGHCLRVRPTLWLQTPAVDLEVNQLVEVLAKQGANDAGIYRIADILYHSEENKIEFHLKRDELIMEREFARDDLHPLEQHYELRAGYYTHPVPKAKALDKSELLNVGDLLDESQSPSKEA